MVASDQNDSASLPLVVCQMDLVACAPGLGAAPSLPGVGSEFC